MTEKRYYYVDENGSLHRVLEEDLQKYPKPERVIPRIMIIEDAKKAREMARDLGYAICKTPDYEDEEK